MQARWIALALAAGIMAAGPAQAGDDHDHDHGEEERVEHFEGKEVGSKQEAVTILRDYNARLEDKLSGELTPEKMNSIHKISYTMENALAKLDGDLDGAAQSLERMHLASERMETDAVKRHAQAYLHVMPSVLDAQ